MGIEPTWSAWKADVLPLNYIRMCKPATVILQQAFEFVYSLQSLGKLRFSLGEPAPDQANSG